MVDPWICGRRQLSQYPLRGNAHVRGAWWSRLGYRQRRYSCRRHGYPTILALAIPRVICFTYRGLRSVSGRPNHLNRRNDYGVLQPVLG